MSCETNCCTFLRGELFIGNSLSSCAANNGLVCGVDAPLKKMGNIESATITVSSQILGTENEFHYKNNKSCTRVDVQSVDIAMTIKCTKKNNMNLAMFSKDHVGDFAIGFRQDFTVCDVTVLRECNFFLFKKGGVILSSVVVGVYDEDNNLLQPLTLDVDYSITPHGIELIQDINVLNVQSLCITYNYDNRSEQGLEEFDFLTEFQGHKFIYFRGTNFAEGEEVEPFGVEIYRVLFNPISQIDLISQGDYFVINLIGRIELDFDKINDGLGGYYKIRRGKSI